MSPVLTKEVVALIPIVNLLYKLLEEFGVYPDEAVAGVNSVPFKNNFKSLSAFVVDVSSSPLVPSVIN